MKKNWNSVFANLAISYITIVLVIVLLLCSIFYMYFPRSYNEEIRNKNQMILENAANYIESAVLQRVKTIYLDLSLGESAITDLIAKDNLKGSYSSVVDIQEMLKSEVTKNLDIVYAVHVFYPKQKIMISSDYGLRYYEDGDNGRFLTMDWIDGMRNNDKSFLWTEARMVPEDIYASVAGNAKMNSVISYAHSYPFNSTGGNSQLTIAIDIKEAAVSQIIRNLMPIDYESTFIMGASGDIISAADKENLSSNVEDRAYAQEILSSNETRDSFTYTVDRIPNVVSYHKLSSNDWKIYTVTPATNFYKKSILLQKAVLVICVLTILVGVVLSGIFTITSYTPLKRLMGRVKGLFDHAADPRMNEYNQIDTAIHKLANRVSSLEETLEISSPVIKHNIVLKILRNSYSYEELAEQLQSINISMEYANFSCMLIDPISKDLKAFSSKKIHYVIYRLIHQLEVTDFHESQIIAEEMPDQKIVVIVCTNNTEEELLEKLSESILAEVRNSFDLEFKIALGHWVQQCLEVHKSFVQAQTLIKYGYFLPDISIIKDRDLLDRESSNAEIPQSILLKFKDKLQARNAEGVVTAIDNLIEAVREGEYSADYCHFILLNTVSVYSDYLISVRYSPSDNVKMSIYNEYTAIYNLDSFREWLVHSITQALGDMEKRSDNRNIDCIEVVKSYISEHLSEELSLDTVASKVYLSPKYLSRIFKEETGMNYIEYVTHKRMEKALELMTTSNMTIEQISNSVGYGTAAYFIKKFKEMNGCTPKNYIRGLMKQA